MRVMEWESIDPKDRMNKLDLLGHGEAFPEEARSTREEELRRWTDL